MVEGIADPPGEMRGVGAGTDSPARQSTAGKVRRSRLARWLGPAALALVAVVLFLCYLRLSGTIASNSDGADQALQAWDMLHGNWLLRGWTVGDVSYYTTEIPEYVIVEMIRGLGPSVVHVAAATTYTLLVLLAGWLAKGRATGREGVLRVLIASGILLAPQLGDGVHLVLLQPDHLGTQVPLLVIFLVLDRAPRRWYTPVSIAVMLTWVLVADRVALLDAALPLVVVCGLRTSLALLRRKPLTSQWFELSLVAAGIVAAGVSELAGIVIRHLGGYISLPLASHLVHPGDILTHLKLTGWGVLILYGANFEGLSPGLATAFAVVHLTGVALALWALCRALRYFFATSELIIPVMAAGIMVNLAVYTFSGRDITWFGAREIAAVLPFGAVLAGRLLARPLAARWVRPILAGVLACNAVALGYGVARPQVADAELPVVAWLEARHLSTGLGTYHEANLITQDSGGRVAVRTVTWLKTGAAPRAYESKASWYDPRLSYANFVVMNSSDGVPGDRVSLIPDREILALAGRPAHTYHYQSFIILVWHHNLLASLRGQPRAGAGRTG